MTLEEAKKIQTDPSHPLHARYAANDPDIVRQVSEAFKREYPGNQESVPVYFTNKNPQGGK